MWKDSETLIDYLDFEHLYKCIDLIVSNDKLQPSTIGIYGDWGSGKSSLMKMTQNILQEKGYTCLMFNGWLFEGYDDAKTALLGTILDEIKKQTKLSDKAKIIVNKLSKNISLFKVFSSALKFGLNVHSSGLIPASSFLLQDGVDIISDAYEKTVEDVKEQLNYNEFRNDIRSFQDNFAQLLVETGITRLVIFIDELDRCSPLTILDTLEAIRLFLFNGNVSFIIGADERQIQYAIENKYKNNFNQSFDIGKEYLEKIIQYPIYIPKLGIQETEYYIMCLFLQNSINDEKKFNLVLEKINEIKKEKFVDFRINKNMFEDKVFDDVRKEIHYSIDNATQLGEVLAIGFNGNPRQCKRFLNTVELRSHMASFRHINLDKQILMKIMLIEYFKPSFFKEIYIRCIDGSLSNWLTAIEVDIANTKTGNDLSEKEKKWYKDVLNYGIKLSSIQNINEYLYFMKSTIDNQIIDIKQNLSNLATNVLNSIIDEKEIAYNDYRKDMELINTYEYNLIIKIIFKHYITIKEVPPISFKLFVNFCSYNKNSRTEFISHLDDFDLELIKPSLIPFLAEWAKKNNDTETIRKILQKTKKPELIELFEKGI